ncbi:oxidoreductase [Brevibacillus reuszeri]|uniref:Oxidoreductase n=1 Tax=Brevibacillus reuszeri TaxID=54915 RepID=A0A0K9YPL9_9BACL|nr:SDR family NAD(P)-dependent oxidoreductase [Brevibacillus reuszeri]KNB70597.1 short-chain dehydrogenase [Brevibacillus reuszeri]MED1861426.1 SDR family NAD(P)-dependent oxidoreductase [Brevibacillus reuszeri]GED69969.1 oxidoreductase [Brevibacillus reuszeri]
MNKNFIVFGASQGLGDAFVRGLPVKGDTVWIVSRTRPRSLDIDDGVNRKWLSVDLSSQQQIPFLKETLKDIVIDVLIYNVGVWEKRGFEDDYSFDNDDAGDIANLLTINLTSTITYIQALLPNVRQAMNGKMILIGSTAGLDHTNNSQVSFVASKFGLRGITNALREHVRKDGISVTCINPGELAADVPYEEGAEKAMLLYQGTRIPVQDIVSIVQCVIHLSPVSCVKEINIPAITDLNA